MKTTKHKIIATKHGDEISGKLVEIKLEDGKTEVYLSTILPGQFKGWHKHTRSTQNFTCIKGTVVVMVYDGNNKRYEKLLSDKEFETLSIPPGNAIGIRCISSSEAFLICTPNPSYDPKDKQEKIDLVLPYDM